MAQDLEMLSPSEDSILVPFRSRATVDEKREDIEYYFRITITWKEDLRIEDQANYVTKLSLKGKERERTKARKFILALYEHGPDYKDQMIPIEMEMYSFASSRAVVRHIVRESGAVVLVTFYGFAQGSVSILAQVYGTEMAVTLAVSLFEHLSSQYERGKNALTLSPQSSASSSSSSSSALAAFVEENQRNVKWNPEEVRNARLPQKVEELLVRWIFEDLSDMEFTVTNPLPDRPPSTISPVTRITTALSSASFHSVDSLADAASFGGVGGAGGDASNSGFLTNGASSLNDTIVIDDDNELDLVVMEQTAKRRVSIIPRTSGEYFNDRTSNLPLEYLDSLANDQTSGDIQAQKLESYRRMNILQEHNGVGSFVSTHPPPHPLVASSHHSPPNRPFVDDHGHSPRPPSSKKIKGLMDQGHVNSNNTGASKMDPVSNNSTKFKEDSTSTSSLNVVEIPSSSPGITNRKVKLKKNCSEDINKDQWMVGLTDEQIATILESEENIENYSNYANHLRRQNQPRTEPTPTARLPPPPPHRLMSSNCLPTQTMIIQTPMPPPLVPSSSSSSTMIASSSPSSMVEIPDVSLRRIVIDGPNVAMAHGNNKRFSCRGILIAVNYFLRRGHERSSIKVYIPQWRQRIDAPFNHIDEPQLLETELEDFVSYTPCRNVEGLKFNSYDDRFIVETAAKNRGIIVSNDKFRDLMNESLAFKEAITYRLLPYNFCEDIFLPPHDPQGKGGPSLDEFLKIYRREMELHEHARPKQSTPPYQILALPPVASATHHQQQQQHLNQQRHPYQQPPTQRHVQVCPPVHQQQSQPSGFNFVPANAAAAAPAAPAPAGHFTSATVSPPRNRNQNDQTCVSDEKRSAAETEDLRLKLLEFFEGQRNLSGMIEEILENFQKEKDLNTLASHVCAISFNA